MESKQDTVEVAALSKSISTGSPRYHLYRYDHSFEGDYQQANGTLMSCTFSCTLYVLFHVPYNVNSVILSKIKCVYIIYVTEYGKTEHITQRKVVFKGQPVCCYGQIQSYRGRFVAL